MSRYLAALIPASLSMLLLVAPAAAMDNTCTDWQDIKPYLTNFFQVEGPQRDNLLQNFNVAEPRTDLHPRIVGYTWMTGWDLVQLYMFDNGCMVLNRPYPRLTIWSMMEVYPAVRVEFDKSSESYAALVDARRTKEEAEFERRRKWRAESGLDVADEETGMSTDDQGAWEMD